MKTGTETPAPRLAACLEIAERLTPALASSLRWLATHPGSGAMLVIEGFVHDGELVLVADIPSEPGLDPGKGGGERPEPEGREPGSRHPKFTMSARRGLLSFTLSLTPNGRKSLRSAGRPAAAPPPSRTLARAGRL